MKMKISDENFERLEEVARVGEYKTLDETLEYLFEQANLIELEKEVE